MSRAINIAASQDDVRAACAKRKIGISAIETLRSGGTRVVMNNANDAATMTKFYRSKVISSAVQRTPLRVAAG